MGAEADTVASDKNIGRASAENVTVIHLHRLSPHRLHSTGPNDRYGFLKQRISFKY